MKEVIELRVNRDFAYLLFGPNEGRKIGDLVQLITLTRDDPRYSELPRVIAEVSEKHGQSFFWGWEIRRSYIEEELKSARLFHIRARTTFEPAGEECGTIYDETRACHFCRSGATQLGPLRLRRRAIPNMDIARTIAGEIVVSGTFAQAVKKYQLKGIDLEPVAFRSEKNAIGNYYQLTSGAPPLDLSGETLVGNDPFDLSTRSGGEVYQCPLGHTLGLNLLSEPHVIDVPFLGSWDFYKTAQRIGVRRGLLRPEPEYLCSPKFRRMVEVEKLRGFRFELAHVSSEVQLHPLRQYHAGYNAPPAN